MARPQRIEYEGTVYHVGVRGNERQAIFQGDADREHHCKGEFRALRHPAWYTSKPIA